MGNFEHPLLSFKLDIEWVQIIQYEIEAIFWQVSLFRTIERSTVFLHQMALILTLCAAVLHLGNLGHLKLIHQCYLFHGAIRFWNDCFGPTYSRFFWSQMKMNFRTEE